MNPLIKRAYCIVQCKDRERDKKERTGKKGGKEKQSKKNDRTDAMRGGVRKLVYTRITIAHTIHDRTEE